MNTDTNFDAIIPGSGMGGLTAASLQAQQNQRVLLLEWHFKLGGFTHVFQRKGKFEWDVGIHYIGEMHKGSTSRALFDYITQGRVKWHKMPEVYDRYVYPDFTFDAHTGQERLQQDLTERFPGEAKAIEQYFGDLKSALEWFNRHMMAKAMPGGLQAMGGLMSRFGAKRALQTTGAYLDKHFKDPQLKAVLVSQWGDYGLPPGQSAFVTHALVASHYFKGGYYPAGGSQVIAEAIVPIIQASGGQALVNHEVSQVVLKDGKAIGVRVRAKHGQRVEEKEFFAGTIISDAGAWNTYQKLLPADLNLPLRSELEHIPPSMANVTLYVGFKDNPRRMGVQGENYWLFGSYDHDDLYARRNTLADGQAVSAFVSFPSLKNPYAETHTAEIIALMDAAPFAAWADQPWKRRGLEYEAFKERISCALLDFTEQCLPGFKDLIEYWELSTPLSTENFTGFRGGEIYGIPATPTRYRLDWLGARTPIPNMYLAGADAAILGVIGALMGGVLAVSVSSDDAGRFMKIMKEARQYSEGMEK